MKSRELAPRTRAERRPSQMGEFSFPLSERAATLVRGLLVVPCFAVMEAVLLGGHLIRGGLYTDDWSLAAIQHQSGTGALLSNLASANHSRPVAALFLALTAALSGTNPQIHALWGMLTLLSAVSSIYLLLRYMGLGKGDALAIALLFMIFPFSDSSWLWYSASHSYLAIAFAAIGAVLALRGVDQRYTTGIVYHCGALAMFALSLLTYQDAAGVICLSTLMYLPRIPWRRAVTFGAIDATVVLLALRLPTVITGSAGSTANQVIPVSGQVDHAKLIGNQGLKLLTVALVPFGDPRRSIVLLVALCIVGLGAGLVLRARTQDEAQWLRRCLFLVVAGGAVLIAAYAVYVPAPINLYQPLGKGEENRVNVMAALGYVTIVFALAMMLASGVVRTLRCPPAWTRGVGLVIVATVCVGYVHRTRQDIASWGRAGSIQRQELRGLRAMGRPPRGTTIYAFGGVGATAPGVFGFRVTWDLNGAVELLWNDPTLHTYPIFVGTEINCTATQVVPIGTSNGDGVGQAADYGYVVFYDVRDHRQQLINSTASCVQAASTYVAGPVES